jgi:hypothetical protein
MVMASRRGLGISFVVLAACGDSGGSSTTTTDTTAGTGGPTTGGPTTGGPTSTTGGPTTGGTTATTAGPTSEGETDGTTAPLTGTGDTTTGETSTGETSTGETTGGPGVAECAGAKDCKLHNDCCVCEGVPAEAMPMDCAKQCVISTCEALKIDAAECRFGTCRTERLRCDGQNVQCDIPTPECPPGSVPEVTENNACWTGACVPLEHCDVVPTCADCQADEMCVTDDTQLGVKRRCEPVPPECQGPPDCDCAGVACDQGAYKVCGEAPDGLHCSCPDC